VNPAPGHRRGRYLLRPRKCQPKQHTLAPAGTPLWKTTWSNFAPRLWSSFIGANTSGHETVLRAVLDCSLIREANGAFGFSGLIINLRPLPDSLRCFGSAFLCRQLSTTSDQPKSDPPYGASPLTPRTSNYLTQSNGISPLSKR